LLIEKLKRICNFFRTSKFIEKEDVISKKIIEEEEVSVIGKRTGKDLARFTQKIATEYINTRDMNNFINCIKGKKIDVVIDLRWSTYHKTKQGFGPTEFKKHLELNGISYFYIKALGNPFHALYDQKDLESDIAKKDYLNYLKYNSKARKSFQELFSKFRFKKKYCLICYCNTQQPTMCHRFWLKEALINYKRKSLDLLEDYILVKEIKSLPEISEMIA